MSCNLTPDRAAVELLAALALVWVDDNAEREEYFEDKDVQHSFRLGGA
jgi:hypothetical protein